VISTRRTPLGLFKALVTSARMRGMLQGSEPKFQHAAAIGSAGQMGLMTLTYYDRVVWLPGALSHPHRTAPRIDLTDLAVDEALKVVFRLRFAA
jgi:hypothetical protein